MNGSQPPPLHPTTTPLSSSRLPPEDEADPNDSFTDEIDVDVDVESLRRVFGSTSPEDLYRRKPHELRALWMEAMQEQEDQKQQQEKQQDEPTDAYAAKQRGLPRFLLDPKDDQHVAPHTFALQLLLGNRNRFRRSKKRGTDGDGLYRKVATKTDDGDDDGDDDDDNEYGEAGSSRGRMASRRRRRPSQSSRKQQQQQQHQHQQRQRLQQQQQQRQRQRQPDLPGSIAMLLLATVAAGSLACQFVLEVLGGAGAIWGCAELFGLRTGGLGHPTGDATQTIALGVGLVCCARFFLVRRCCGCCGAGAPESSPSVRDRFRRLVRSHRNGNSNGNGRWALGLELARIAADDPVRFLHPAHGPVSWSWSLCGRSSARDEDDVDYQDDENENEYEDDEERNDCDPTDRPPHRWEERNGETETETPPNHCHRRMPHRRNAAPGSCHRTTTTTTTNVGLTEPSPDVMACHTERGASRRKETRAV
eukprot:jgi/Psemu1/70035/estExt_Genemark1.C_13120002